MLFSAGIYMRSLSRNVASIVGNAIHGRILSNLDTNLSLQRMYVLFKGADLRFITTVTLLPPQTCLLVPQSAPEKELSPSDGVFLAFSFSHPSQYFSI